MSYVTKSGKEYVCVMQVHCDFDVETLKKILSQFVGTIYQKPPVRSSVKRRVRKRTIHSIDLLEVSGRLALLRVSSEPGTYMRKLCHDVGIILGCGSHMRELRRTRSGPFTEFNKLVTLHEVSEAVYLWKNCKDDSEIRRVVLPMEYATCGMPKVVVSDGAVNAITYGATLNIPGIVAYQSFTTNDNVAILTLKGELVAIGKPLISSGELERKTKGQAIQPKRVLLERDVYPKSWT
jgi:H/ACA ribonucleoprotein complex subunit 4